ncbi:hypothetical protein [Streptomyces platensis]|uniref:hypothetical protein n=1 Tax=Streptomyces platensis TaxID=58346 RepID=UPI001F2AB8EB|nr:hypothetical protein [Streptomyces platensis]MCF3144923.1 hypothetical protein [Streptomyces platensis]
MFNRIRHTVAHPDEWCVPMSRLYRLPVSVGRAVAPPDRVAHNWFATAEAL